MDSIFEVKAPENLSDSTMKPMDKELKVCPKCRGQIRIEHVKDRYTWAWPSKELVPFCEPVNSYSSFSCGSDPIEQAIGLLKEKISITNSEISKWEKVVYPFECATGESFIYSCNMCGFRTRGKTQNIKIRTSLIEALQIRYHLLDNLKAQWKKYIEEIENIRKAQGKSSLESKSKKKKSWWGNN